MTDVLDTDRRIGLLEARVSFLEAELKRLGARDEQPQDGEQIFLFGTSSKDDDAIRRVFAREFDRFTIGEKLEELLCEIHRRAWRSKRAPSPKSKGNAKGFDALRKEKRRAGDVARAILGMRVEPQSPGFDRERFNGFDYLVRRFDVYVEMGMKGRGPLLRERIVDGRWKDVDAMADHEGDAA